jgi:DNA (cytosine-5)-methyltransferase 1
MKNKLKCVSLFSGGGGLDLGLEAAGFETVFATDIDEHSCNALITNKKFCKETKRPFLSKAKIICKDVTQISGNEILESIGMGKGELDLLAGGPPCQAFSVFGKRMGRNDPRGQLVFHYLRLLREVQPKAFVFENVAGLLTVEKGGVFKELVKKLSKPSDGLNYKISVHRLNASDYGVPQFRDRVFIIGARDGSLIPAVEKLTDKTPSDDSLALPWRTVGNGLQGLPSIADKKTHNHIGRVHSERIIDRYSQMAFGERDHFTRINRLDPSRPSYTIIVGSNAGGGKGHVHPYEGREVTPRESARMQCFPDWWWFSGTSRHPIRQVGNAVPTLLAYAVGRQVILDVFKLSPTPRRKALDLLDQTHLFSDVELKKIEEFDRQSQQKNHVISKKS